MAQSPPRTRLEQRAHAAHLSVRDFVARFHRASTEIGENVHVSERQAKRWLDGTSDTPRPASCRVLQHWWGEPVARLFGPPHRDLASIELSEEELVVNTGRESTEHAIEAAATLEPSALEHLHAEAARLARILGDIPLRAMFTNLVRLRDTVYRQLDRTNKPRQRAELYLIAGQACGLLSITSECLGYVDAAEEQARAAYTYGELIDHPSLCAFARSRQAYIAYWSDRPRRAAAIAEAALAAAPAGTARAHLHAAHARALSRIGARQEVASSLALTAEELDRAGDDELLDEIGGGFGYPRYQQAISAGACYLALGEGQPAETEATTALELIGELPEQHRLGAGQEMASADLATSRLLRGELAGVEDALTPVFAVDAERRSARLVRRLTDLDRLLATARYRGTTEAARIGEQVEEFTVRAVARPSLPTTG